MAAKKKAKERAVIRYVPQGLEPCGHDLVCGRLAKLAAAVRTNEDATLHHAYVFAGPDGIGKYTTAMWWARKLKCERDGACGECPSCRQISAGSHPDVVALEPEEPGKRIGIDPVRDVIRKMTLRPRHRGPRVSVIRDAHLLTFEAQNAMLKLLEEPPGTAVIVLVTPAAGSLLATVRSRCQVLRFDTLDGSSILSILEAAGVPASEHQARVKAADGSPARALALDAEALAARDALIEVFEALNKDRFADLEDLTRRLAEKSEERDGNLRALFTWQMTKARDAARANDPDTATLVAQAERTSATIRMIQAGVNAKAAVRDMLLDVRG